MAHHTSLLKPYLVPAAVTIASCQSSDNQIRNLPFFLCRDELKSKGQGHFLSQMVDDLEACWSLRLEPGYTPGLRFMGHLWEPLKAQWRPLVFYVGTEVLSWFARHMLERWGFQQYKHQ